MDLIKNITDATPLVQGGMTLMFAGWLGYQLRAIPARLYDWLRHWATRQIQIRDQSPLYEAWLEMLTEASVRPGGPRTLEVRLAGASDDAQGDSGLRAGSDAFWARLHGKWCRVWIGRENGSAGGNGGGDLMRRFMISVEVIWGTRADLARMLAEAKRRSLVEEHRQIVELCDKWGSRHTLKMPKRAPGTLCLPSGLYEGIEARIRSFLESREAYERAGIPWRFGILLHGAPGTGKTSISHVLASRLGMRLAVIPLADLRSDEDLVSAFTSVGARAIVLLEDVDSAFRKRKSGEAEGITFSGFLNCIDGMLAPHDGRVLIMSTNHPETLDAALIRPGRVDLNVEVPLLSRQAAFDYVDRVFAHVPARHEIADEVMRSEKPTAAALLNRIMQEAWQGRPSAEQPAGRRRIGVDAPIAPVLRRGFLSGLGSSSESDRAS